MTLTIVQNQDKEAAALRRHYEYASPLGSITLVAEGGILVGLYFSQQVAQMSAARLGCAASPADFAQVIKYLDNYFAAAMNEFTPTYRLYGTSFQLRVWEQLLLIEAGQTKTYRQIAEAINQPKAVRAVGKAIGDNPISIIVPCHRVLGTNGSLTGYAGGLENKKKLLMLEGIIRD